MSKQEMLTHIQAAFPEVACWKSRNGHCWKGGPWVIRTYFYGNTWWVEYDDELCHGAVGGEKLAELRVGALRRYLLNTSKDLAYKQMVVERLQNTMRAMELARKDVAALLEDLTEGRPDEPIEETANG
jgi:hypothetical protein